MARIGGLTMICIVLLSGTDGLARHPVRKTGEVEGFRELGWGASIEQSSRIYRDLEFDKYEISNGKEEPWKVYVRRSEKREIEDVSFDSIEYWFREGRFRQVRAVMRSRIGPRTLVTRAEDAFDRITARLKNRYGDPTGNKVDYVTEFLVVVKETTWTADHSSFIIKYEGTGRTNEDLLSLTIRRNR